MAHGDHLLSCLPLNTRAHSTAETSAALEQRLAQSYLSLRSAPSTEPGTERALDPFLENK